MACATCQNWDLRGKTLEQRQMARLQFGLCKLGTRWTFFAPTHTCTKHESATPEVIEARRKWATKGSK